MGRINGRLMQYCTAGVLGVGAIMACHANRGRGWVGHATSNQALGSTRGCGFCFSSSRAHTPSCKSSCRAGQRRHGASSWRMSQSKVQRNGRLLSASIFQCLDLDELTWWSWCCGRAATRADDEHVVSMRPVPSQSPRRKPPLFSPRSRSGRSQ